MSEKKGSTEKDEKIKEQLEADIEADIADVAGGTDNTDADDATNTEDADAADETAAKEKSQAAANTTNDTTPTTSDRPARSRGPQQRGGMRPRRGPRPPREKEPSEFDEKVLAIDRVTRVVKGGRRLRFRALIVVGDRKGRVAYGLGKGNEVAAATAKASYQAKRKMKHVPIIDGTLPHDTAGKSRGSKVLLKAAKKGRGLIAGGSVRTVLELAGYNDVVAKSFGSSNKINMVRATLIALDNVITKPEKKTAPKKEEKAATSSGETKQKKEVKK